MLSGDRKHSDAISRILDENQRAGLKSRRLVANYQVKPRVDRGSCFVRESENDDARSGQKIEGEDRTEVEIEGQDYSVLGPREFADLGIRRAC